MFGSAKDKAGDVAEKAAPVAEAAWEKTKDVAGDVAEKTAPVAEAAWEKTKDVAEVAVHPLLQSPRTRPRMLSRASRTASMETTTARTENRPRTRRRT